MLHRSRAGHALSAGLAIACLLSLLPGAAHGATRPVPADAPTVATTPSGAAVIAWVVGGRTCTVLQEAGEPRPTTLSEDGGLTAVGDANGTCVTTPVLSRFHADLSGHLDRATQTETLWGLAGPGAATLEARREGKVVAASPTTAAALPGPAAHLRFWALDLPTAKARTPDEIAVLDASGAVRRAWSPENFNLSLSSRYDEETSASGKVLRRGRAGASTWTLRRTVERQLEPTPLQPERRVEVRCLNLAIATTSKNGTSHDGTSHDGPCDDGAPLDVMPLAVQDSSSCGVGIALSVLVRAPVRSAVAVLGDGSRRTLPLSALGGAIGARGGALLVAPGVAVRRVEGLGAGGRVVQKWSLTAAPVGRRCPGSTGTGWTSFVGYGIGTDALGAAPRTARAADAGAKLCVAIDRAPRAPEDCALPPVDPEEAWISAVDAPGGEYLYGLVPVEVTAARLLYLDGTAQTVPATPIPGYTGQYATTIAQVALDVAAPKALRSAVLLDAGGRVLGRTQRLGPYAVRTGAAKTLRPAVGTRPAVRARPVTLTIPNATVRYTCLQVGTGLDPDDCTASVTAATSGAETVQVLANCDPHQIVVLAVLRHATDRLVIQTGTGREVVARNLPIPAAAGGAAGRFVAFAVLGPHETIAGLRLRGKAARKLDASYPAAAEQCGYVGEPGSAYIS